MGVIETAYKPPTARLARIIAAVALIAPICLSAHGQVPNPASDPGRWRDFALRVCTACHVVTLDQPDAPILRPPAPSFRAIAGRPGTTAQSLRDFIATTHATLKSPANMPNPQLSDAQVDGIVSYILTFSARR